MFLLERIASLPAFRDVLEACRNGRRIPGLGLPRPARLPVLAALHAALGNPVLFIVDRADHALQLHDELAFWVSSDCRYLFSEPAPLFYEDAVWGNVTRQQRLQALMALAGYHLPGTAKPTAPPVVVTSARALMTRTMPRRDFLQASRRLQPGQNFPLTSLLEHCLKLGYQPVDTVLEAGQIAHRGGLLDVWPPAEPGPARLEFFGEEIETLRRFDPASQRTVEQLDSILITPAREYLLPQTRQGLPEQLSEFHIPLLYPLSSCLLDYLPQGALVLLDDFSLLESTVAEIEEQAVRLRAESIAEGTLPENYPIPYFSWSELLDSLNQHFALELGYSTALATPTGEPAPSPLASCFGTLERFGGRLKPFLDYLDGLRETSEAVVIASRQASRLEELWGEQKRGETTRRAPQFLEASLSGGWTLQDGSSPPIYLITDSEIFGWERPQPRQRPAMAVEMPEAVYADLRPGDWVVHVDHGIGRFLGLVQRTLEGYTREYLCVEYKNGDQIYVPVHQADRLTRYVGPDSSPPALASLGNQEWPEARRRARAAAQEVAAELLDLYARRQLAEGFAFDPDTPWQSELESSFPYMETEDQIKALAEIKQDMESPRPMDRLLCGDVGYGKTEVALRAAFKAVMSGKQAAVLVPTTILAQQHYDTFRHRLAAFPVTVEMLSRFRTPREQEQILYGLAVGAIDIVIGTHRLIQPDVQFHDLGLVIIDEEQRFGVTHKEFLKKLRTEVDVLTLTATPIPRTLYMALTGVRDISRLNTPPEERLPVVTHIGPYSPKLVRQAILRELERGGQVFFVHNRVQTIHAMRMHLEKLVPEARIAIAHGQMPEQELAQVMRRFTAGKVDVLLATSIIESGLDIPNANTLIVDRADTFGLAQLYQLRGRVGRGAMRAYAYFFRHRKRTPTPEGQERLEILAEHAQLGAGFSIALRDLEMRGAGELLGARQSGHIAAVGFHLYTRLLAAAVRHLRRARGLPEPPQDATLLNTGDGLPVNVELPLPSGIPETYVPEANLRLRLYRRLADLTDEAALDALAEEFVDRFGPLPEMVVNLFYQLRVKMRAERAGLASVSVEGGQIVLRYPAPPEGAPAPRLPDLAPDIRGGKNAYWCTFGKAANWRERLLEALERCASLPRL